MAGAYVGHLLRLIITVVGTSFLGAVLLVQSIAKIHIELDDFTSTLVTEPSTYVGWIAGYAILFLCLLLTGIWYQSRWIMRQGTMRTAVRPGPLGTGRKERDIGRQEHQLDSDQLRSLGILVVILVESSSANARNFLKHSLFQVMRKFSGLHIDYLDVLETAQKAVRSDEEMDEEAMFREHVSILQSMGSARFRQLSSALASAAQRMNEHQLALIQIMKEESRGT